MNGIFLISHENVARGFLSAAGFILGAVPAPENVDFLEMGKGATPDNVENLARQKIQNLLKNNDGVLILTDLFGASPANLAARLIAENVAAVSGLNLAMLLRALNYRNLDLAQLAEKAKEGGVMNIEILKGENRAAP